MKHFIVLGTRDMLARDTRLSLTMAGTPIQQVNKIKLLGVTIDERLTWSDHIDTIVVKMGQGIGVVRRCSPYITPLIRKEVTHALVLSHLEYCMVVWSSAAKMDIRKTTINPK